MWKHEVGVGIEFEFLSKFAKQKKETKNKNWIVHELIEVMLHA